MKILIGNNKKLKSYYLPNNNYEYHIIYRSIIDNEEKDLKISKQDDKWYLTSTLNFSLYENNQSLDMAQIRPNHNYTLIINDCNEKLFLYCQTTTRVKYRNYKIDTNSVKVGKNSDDIIINDSYDNMFIIEKVNNNWYIRKSRYNLYINNISVDNTILSLGDEIFCNGLRLVWYIDYIRVIRKPHLQVLLPKIDTISIKSNVLPKETLNKSDYVLEPYTPINRERIVIDNTKDNLNNKDIPSLLIMGISFLLAITSITSLIASIIDIANNNSTIKEELPIIIISIVLIIISIIFPLITKKWQKKKPNNEYKEEYLNYLNNKEEELNNLLQKQSLILNNNNPSSDKCLNIIDNSDAIGTRSIKDSNFLEVRLGTSDIKAYIDIDTPNTSLIKDNEIKYKISNILDSNIIRSAPLTISLTTKITSFLIDNSFKTYYIDMLIIQLITLYNSNQLKLVFIVNENNNRIWDKYKYLVHTFSEDIRLFAYIKEDRIKIND